MSERSGARILLEVLKAEGVDVVFGIPGGSVIPILDAFHSEKDVRFILMRHEQGAGHAADGYARATGKVGVCLATSGPGATNLVTALATANCALASAASARMASTVLCCASRSCTAR